MNPWKSRIVLGVAGLALLGYGALFFPSYDGYGYAGHDGFRNRASFFYFGGINTHHNPNLRRGSRGGPRVRGGGIHGGK